MPYSHYGEIGDIWKHLPLCEVLVAESDKAEIPLYLETNAARASYALTGTPRQRYGVYHFYAHAVTEPVLARSPYLAQLREANPDCPAQGGAALCRYRGSPALALHLLGASDTRFLFCDLEAPPLADVRAYAARLGLAARVRTVRGDSIAGTFARLDDLPAGSFLHIDPYELFTPDAAGRSYFDLFVAAVQRGLRVLAWYGYFTGQEQARSRARIQAALPELAGHVVGVELYQASIQPDEVLFNPGIVGCGVLGGNLGADSRAALAAHAAALERLYAHSHYAGHSATLARHNFSVPC